VSIREAAGTSRSSRACTADPRASVGTGVEVESRPDSFPELSSRLLDVTEQLVVETAPGASLLERRQQVIVPFRRAAGRGRRGHDNDRIAHSVVSQSPGEVRDDGVERGRIEPVGLVEYKHQLPAVSGHRPDVVDVETGIPVLLGVGDPDDDIHKGKDPIDSIAVTSLHGVGVGEIEETNSGTGIPMTLLHCHQVEVAVHCRANFLGDDGGDMRGRGSDPTCLRYLVADDGIEQRRLTRAGSAGEGGDQ
jgi:hypothetical protein